MRTFVDQPVGLSVTADGCAAFWPGTAGWHSLLTRSSEWPFYVRAAGDGRTLHAALDAAATVAMATADPDPSLARTLVTPLAAPVHERMASWPWVMGWLVVMAVIWW